MNLSDAIQRFRGIDEATTSSMVGPYMKPLGWPARRKLRCKPDDPDCSDEESTPIGGVALIRRSPARLGEDSRRKPSKDRAWGTGPASRWDMMSPKLRRKAAIALRRAGVHPTKSSQADIDAALAKDQDFQGAMLKQQDRAQKRSRMTRSQKREADKAQKAKRGKGKGKCWGACLLRRKS